MNKIRLPVNKIDYDLDYNGWANVNNGRNYISGHILGKDGIWHSFAADSSGQMMEIDGRRLNEMYLGASFKQHFVDIKITYINGHRTG